ncbi:MAG: glucosaminidase domain-containing protein [Eubacterium sp.]|nr:glucosaminidase domain-containing protein [Eubacterium sp.]
MIAISMVLAMVVAGFPVSPCVVHATIGTDPLAYGSSNLTPYVGEDTLEKDHVITGRISLSDGRPAGAQKVRLEKKIQYHADFDEIRTAWVTYGETTTDANGEYRLPVASYRVYRLASGGVLGAHSDPVWLNGTDATINLTVAFCSLQGILKNESGMAVSDMEITLKSGDDEQTILTDTQGVFTYADLAPGTYDILVGRTKQFLQTVNMTDDDFILLSISDDQVLMEEYQDGVLEEVGDDGDEYGTELDLPGSLLPTPTPTSDPSAIPDMSGDRLFKGKTIYTDYAYSLEDYAQLQYRNVPRVSVEKYLSLLDPAKDTTKNMKFLRVDEYRPVNEKAFIDLYQSMIESYCKATGRDPSVSVLYGKADVILKMAKKYKIDPIFLTTQTFHESAYGTSHLASGIRITRVAVPGYPRDNHGRFVTKELKEPATVYNLYGIKAYDSDPVTGGTSYAYYSGWTSPTKAIEGAAAYLASNYIHGEYIQNTPFKIRFSFRERIWHQYATGPTYAEDLARYMITMAGVYSVKAKFTYDLPRYKTD